MESRRLEVVKLRRPPIRFTLILLAVGFVLVTAPGSLLPLPVDQVSQVLGLIALGVGTDTMRPSGVPWGASLTSKGVLRHLVEAVDGADASERTRILDRRGHREPGPVVERRHERRVSPAAPPADPPA